MFDANLTFNNKVYALQNLINDIDVGNIALPDLQRPFVWDAKKARDLIDSLYKGLPVGVVILWEILEVDKFKKINQENKRDPRFLVIDGQQRLTSLYSIIKNKNIISKNVREFKIKISFNPIEEKFEVYNVAVKTSKEWIPDISILFENSSSYSIITNYLNKISTLNIDIDQSIIAHRIEKIRNILNYPFQVIELSTELDPEEVSEIFVRINSKGQTLNQSDFILTLMSVYWPEGREQLEKFHKESHKPPKKKESSYNIMAIQPTPEQLIRTIVGYSFDRGRLKYAYLILKGRDLENRQISTKLRSGRTWRCWAMGSEWESRRLADVATMAPVNFHQWKKDLLRVLLTKAEKMARSGDNEWDPFIAAWLCYALTTDEIGNNQPLLNLINRMKRWLNEEEAWSYQRNLGPIAFSFWLFHKTGDEDALQPQFINQLIQRLLTLDADYKWSVLRDPQQVFLLALGAVVIDDDLLKGHLIRVATQQMRFGTLGRRLLFAAALREMDQQVEVEIFSLGPVDKYDAGDMITLVWWAQRYQGDKQKAWDRFAEIAESIALNPENALNHQRILSIPEMAILYRAVSTV